jgi:hypothetical protein
VPERPVPVVERPPAPPERPPIEPESPRFEPEPVRQPRRAAVYLPPEKKGLSPTVVAILAAVGIAALLAVLYVYVLPNRSGSEKAETAQTTLQKPGPAGSAAHVHPLAKHLEVSGVRMRDLKGGKATIQFVVTNHSGAELPPITMDLTVRSADKVFFEVPVKLPSLGPYEVKDLSASVATELKSYELPDWQMVRPQFQLRTE